MHLLKCGKLLEGGRRGHDRVVVGFTTTYPSSAYQPLKL